MELALGHRGSIKIGVLIDGRSAHASTPERGINALYKAIKMIKKIKKELIPHLPNHPIYGATSLAITQIEVKPKVYNMIPEKCRFYIDCRNTPNFSAEDLKKELERLAEDIHYKDQNFNAHINLKQDIIGKRDFTGFYTQPDSVDVQTIEAILTEILSKKPKLKIWRFATDGRFYSWKGIPVIGFGPGNETFAHTRIEHVKITDYLEAIKAYVAIMLKVTGSI
jgi:acetylornithine deacetylase/succinyl-diaminopimelate desuccinylase-like protein